MDEYLRLLEREFCPPLDATLVRVVYADYEGGANATHEAREVLGSLRDAALAEQATEFDPSGSSGGGDAMRSHSPGKLDFEENNSTEWRSQTADKDPSVFSNELSELSLGGRSGSASEESLVDGCFKDSEHWDTATKELELAKTFPMLRLDFVAHILRKCNDDIEKATDELLNHAFFEDGKTSPIEEVPIARGIDAFSEEHHIPQRGKRGKGRKKLKGVSLHSASSASVSTPDSGTSTPPLTNKWHEGYRDVDFIASCTKVPQKTISSAYHRNGGSVSATIMALIERNIKATNEGQDSDEATISSAMDLVSDFPTISLEHAVALVRLSAPSTVNAHELAKALVSQPTAAVASGDIKVVPSYTPMRINSPIEETRLPSLAPSAVPQTHASLFNARNAAFTQASAAYRKGKSTPLMRAVAGYYSQVGRDLNANLKVINEIDADAIVESQSSPTHLDLHGVSVHSATRIARAKTQAWWEALGEDRIPGGGRRGIGPGYRIVTGLGRHSEGGRGKIGPAVMKSLTQAGWKIEVGNGELVVWGRVRTTK